jgi:Coenzyme PQQ synthesis protein D (PqqD)
MKRIAPSHPKMRVQGLLIDELPEELLVYDLERQKAHCLNHTAALVWRRCDGKTTVTEIAAQLSRQFDAPCNEELVWLALRQLDALDLLEQSISLPPHLTGLSRRQMIRNIGLAAAIAVPVVTSIVAPTAVQAATCTPSGNPCNPVKLCCSPLGCNSGTGRCF